MLPLHNPVITLLKWQYVKWKNDKWKKNGIGVLLAHECHNINNAVRAIAPGDQVTAGMVVGTTYDVSVCEMKKVKCEYNLKMASTG